MIGSLAFGSVEVALLGVCKAFASAHLRPRTTILAYEVRCTTWPVPKCLAPEIQYFKQLAATTQRAKLVTL